MTNPYLNRLAKKKEQSPAYWRSRKQEKEMTKRAGGLRIAGSGNGLKKGDVCARRVHRMELKSTSAKSFTVTLAMIEQIEDAALGSNEIPSITVEFLDPTGKRSKEISIIPTEELLRLLRMVDDK